MKDQVEGNKDDVDTVFKAFANSFEKSSSHWQARDEYLSDIKQTKNQTTAELDIYMDNRPVKFQSSQTNNGGAMSMGRKAIRATSPDLNTLTK